MRSIYRVFCRAGSSGPRHVQSGAGPCASWSSRTIVKSRRLSAPPFNRKGTPSTSCTTASGAAEQACAVDYDAVVLDLMLPGRSGFQVLRDIRARKAVDARADPDRKGFASTNASPASTAALTTTWSSRSPWRSCRRACARCSAADAARNHAARGRSRDGHAPASGPPRRARRSI